jgi:hypothetical protein
MKLLRIFLSTLLCSVFAPTPARAAAKPKVRAITAFVRLERAQYQTQIRDAVGMLRRAKSMFEQAGYEVQTIRISTQPFPEYTSGLDEQEVLAFFRAYDRLAEKEGFDASIGPALLLAGEDPRRAELLGEILLNTKILNGTIVVAGEDGVHWESVRAAAALIKKLSAHSVRSQANFRFAALALPPADTPFYPASYNTGSGRQFAIGLESANVVADALGTNRSPAAAREGLRTQLGDHARTIEAVARAVGVETGWQYLGLDLSPAPLRDVSIGAAIEQFTGSRMGSPGTLTAAALITGALQSIPVKRVGYSGLFLPVLEDSVLARRWSEGTLSLDALLSYSSVCGAGLDVIPLPGDITQQQLERIIGDMASLAVKHRKSLSARLLPVSGKKAGQRTEFDDPFLVNAVLQPLP